MPVPDTGIRFASPCFEIWNRVTPGDDGWVSGSIRSALPLYALPINIPAANTNAPPSTTWKAARRKVVSMYLF